MDTDVEKLEDRIKYLRNVLSAISVQENTRLDTFGTSASDAADKMRDMAITALRLDAYSATL